MRVCLVRPPTITFEDSISTTSAPPLGLAYVAGALKSAEFNVYVIDAPGDDISRYSYSQITKGALLHGLTYNDIVDRIEPGTEVIGVAVMFASEWLHARELIKMIKSRFPSAHLVIGGEQASALSEYSMQDCPAIDSCVVGEGELTIVELCTRLKEGKPLDSVEGLIYRDDGVIKINTRRARITDVDSIAEPAWELFNVESYITHGYTNGTDMGRSIPMLASRGCPYQCTFCSNPVMWTTAWKPRSPAAVIREMKSHMARYNIRNFDFYDLTAIVKREWIIEFCQLLIKENLNIFWQLPSGTRSEVIDSEVAQLLYASGCRHINYAPESGSKEELKRIKKKVNIENMLASMRSSNKSGLSIKANMIFGLPGSTWSDVRNSFGFLAKMALAGVQDVGCFSFSPYPGSAMFSDLLREKKIKINDNYFNNVLLFNSPVESISYSENFTGRQIKTINLSAMMFFYSLNFLFRPWRFYQVMRALATGDRSLKLTMALYNKRRKKLAARSLAGSN